MAKEAGSRMSSLFPSFGGDRSRAKSPGASRLSRSREPSPDPQARAASKELRSSRSSHNLGARSQDLDERGRQPRLSSLMTGAPTDASAPGDGALMPPPPIAGFGDRVSSPGGSQSSGQRPMSSGGSVPGSRPDSPGGDWLRPTTPSEGKPQKRGSWLSGSKPHSRNASGAAPAHTGPNWAFVVGPQGKTPYDTTPLVNSQPVRSPLCSVQHLLKNLGSGTLGRAGKHARSYWGQSFRSRSSIQVARKHDRFFEEIYGSRVRSQCRDPITHAADVLKCSSSTQSTARITAYVKILIWRLRLGSASQHG